MVIEARALKRKVALCASDFLRAWQTAEHIFEALKAAGIEVWLDSIRMEVALRERYFGELDATSANNYQQVWQLDATDGFHTRWGVESTRHVQGRVETLMERLKASLDPDKWLVVLVSHGDCLQIAQTTFAGKRGPCPRLCSLVCSSTRPCQCHVSPQAYLRADIALWIISTMR